jgi:hypothetical protein
VSQGVASIRPPLLLNRFLLFTYNSIEAVDPMNRPVTVDIINML